MRHGVTGEGSRGFQPAEHGPTVDRVAARRSELSKRPQIGFAAEQGGFPQTRASSQSACGQSSTPTAFSLPAQGSRR